jgi:hypothetical protein
VTNLRGENVQTLQLAICMALISFLVACSGHDGSSSRPVAWTFTRDQVSRAKIVSEQFRQHPNDGEKYKRVVFLFTAADSACKALSNCSSARIEGTTLPGTQEKTLSRIVIKILDAEGKVIFINDTQFKDTEVPIMAMEQIERAVK